MKNVLLILTDEHRFDCTGFNGHRYVRTPHLDRLAASAVNYRRHTCSTPLCTPARASLLTGQYPRTHGAVSVGYVLDPQTPTLATWLGRAGYTCGYFGKSHLEPELTGFVERMDASKPYYGFRRFALSEDNLIGPYLDWIRREHPQWEEAAWSQANEACQKPPIHDNPERLDAVYASPLPVELTQSAWITQQTTEFIREQTARARPYFAVCSYVPPHHPWTPPEPYTSMYDPATLPVPSRKPADHRWPWPVGAYSWQPTLLDRELQRMTAAYYALITMLDDCIGRLLATVSDETIVVFTSDHGDYNGDHGLIRKGGVMYDNLLRVPLLIRVPGQQAGCSDVLTQHEDLVPTLLDLLGLPKPGSIQGQPFSRRRHVFFECPGPAGRPGPCGVSNAEWKLLHYPNEHGFVLVNSDTDPAEDNNLAGDPRVAAVESELKQALFQWLLTTPSHRAPKTAGW